MALLEKFSFTDPDGKQWDADKDYRTDAASIPEALWSFVGSPFTDNYRRAAIVHDIACVNASDDAQRLAADEMFYHACRAGGCYGTKLFPYTSVYESGPSFPLCRSGRPHAETKALAQSCIWSKSKFAYRETLPYRQTRIEPKGRRTT